MCLAVHIAWLNGTLQPPTLSETSWLVVKASNVSLAAAEAAAAQAEVAAPEPLPEPFTSLFKQAKENPTEFTTWTSLITATEKLVR